eukprot:8740096-Karenia_brevis.AAC.1
MSRKQEPVVKHVSLQRIDAKDASDSLGVQATWRSLWQVCQDNLDIIEFGSAMDAVKDAKPEELQIAQL